MPEQKKAVVPRLRFPEFRNAGPWEVKRLGDVVHLEYVSSLPESKRLDGAVPVIGSNGVVGYHNQSLVAGPTIVIGRKGSAGQVTWIESPCYPIDTTFYVTFNQPSDVRRFIYFLLVSLNLPQLARAEGVPGLNRDEVEGKKVGFPSVSEQQKIADCLSSLDEVIELQAQKLEALKAHKQGLMQQLFPREGETTPRLRFPEFRNAGPWEVKRLGDVLDVRNMRRTASPEVPLFSLTIEQGITEKTDRYNREFLVIDRSNKRYKLVLPGDIVYNPANLRWGAIAVSKVPYPIVVSPIYEVLCPKKHISICHDFIGIALMLPQQISRFASKGQGTLVERIAVKVEDFLDTLIAIPAQIEEQQKIADCLSSLDELIELQAKKLEALQAHKKGLMQQLFPQEVG